MHVFHIMVRDVAVQRLCPMCVQKPDAPCRLPTAGCYVMNSLDAFWLKTQRVRIQAINLCQILYRWCENQSAASIVDCCSSRWSLFGCFSQLSTWHFEALLTRVELTMFTSMMLTGKRLLGRTGEIHNLDSASRPQSRRRQPSRRHQQRPQRLRPCCEAQPRN